MNVLCANHAVSLRLHPRYPPAPRFTFYFINYSLSFSVLLVVLQVDQFSLSIHHFPTRLPLNHVYPILTCINRLILQKPACKKWFNLQRKQMQFNFYLVLCFMYTNFDDSCLPWRLWTIFFLWRWFAFPKFFFSCLSQDYFWKFYFLET